MSNLKSIRDQVLLQSNNIPNSTSYFSHLNDIINKNVTDVWMSKPWKFNTKTIPMNIWPDKTSESSSSDPTNPVRITGMVGVNAVEFTGYVLQPTDVFQTLEIEGRDYTLIGIVDNYRALISQAYLGNGEVTDHAVLDSTDWKVKHTSYFLPSDVAEIMDVSFRDRDIVGQQNRGKIEQIPMRMSIDYGLSTQRTSDLPTVYVPAQPYYFPFPMAGSGPATANSLIYVDATIASPSVDPIVAGEYYVGVSIVASTPSYFFGDIIPETPVLWSNTPYVLNGTDEELILEIHNTQEQSIAGRFYRWWIGVDNGVGEIVGWAVGVGEIPPGDFQPEATFVVSREAFKGTIGITYNNDPNFRIRPRIDHSQKVVEFYPRPQIVLQEATEIIPIGAFTENPDITSPSNIVVLPMSTWDLRYVWQVPRMSLNSDLLYMPEEFAHLIVDMTLSDLYLMLNNPVSSSLHSAKAKERMRILESRYADEKDHLAVRRNSWNVSRSGTMGYGARNLVRYQ